MLVRPRSTLRRGGVVFAAALTLSAPGHSSAVQSSGSVFVGTLSVVRLVAVDGNEAISHLVLIRGGDLRPMEVVDYACSDSCVARVHSIAEYATLRTATSVRYSFLLPGVGRLVLAGSLTAQDTSVAECTYSYGSHSASLRAVGSGVADVNWTASIDSGRVTTEKACAFDVQFGAATFSGR